VLLFTKYDSPEKALKAACLGKTATPPANKETVESTTMAFPSDSPNFFNPRVLNFSLSWPVAAATLPKATFSTPCAPIAYPNGANIPSEPRVSAEPTPISIAPVATSNAPFNLVAICQLLSGSGVVRFKVRCIYF
jgi:hypothetical protein